MTVLHGFANASGARPAVLSVPVRRTLVLLGLLCGALTALWLLGASSAQAAEAEDLPLVGDAGLGDTGLVETTERVDDTLTGAGHEGAEAVREVSETVAPRTSEQVETALEPVAETVEPVHETLDSTLDEVTAEVGGHLDDTVAATGLTGADQGAGTAPDQASVPQRSAAPAEEAEPETEPAAQVHEGPHVLDELPGAGAAAAEATASASAEANTSAADPAERTASSSTSAHTGTAIGLTCANFPSRVGLPAPMPGLDQAARHFLHAVPSAAADEPTFAPD